MPKHSDSYYRRWLKEIFPSYSDKEIKSIVDDTIARARNVSMPSVGNSIVEDRGERIEDRDTYTYPLLGRKLRLTERQKLENVQKSRTPNETER